MGRDLQVDAPSSERLRATSSPRPRRRARPPGPDSGRLNGRLVAPGPRSIGRGPRRGRDGSRARTDRSRAVGRAPRVGLIQTSRTWSRSRTSSQSGPPSMALRYRRTPALPKSSNRSSRKPSGTRLGLMAARPILLVKEAGVDRLLVPGSSNRRAASARGRSRRRSRTANRPEDEAEGRHRRGQADHRESRPERPVRPGRGGAPQAGASARARRQSRTAARSGTTRSPRCSQSEKMRQVVTANARLFETVGKATNPIRTSSTARASGVPNGIGWYSWINSVTPLDTSNRPTCG